MSQRLHIGTPIKDHYDCVITSMDGALQKLLDDWLCISHGHFLSPWKIVINDNALWLEIEPIVKNVIEALSRQYPEDVSCIVRWDEEGKDWVRLH
jgi:hypothetical protein